MFKQFDFVSIEFLPCNIYDLWSLFLTTKERETDYETYKSCLVIKPYFIKKLEMCCWRERRKLAQASSQSGSEVTVAESITSKPEEEENRLESLGTIVRQALRAAVWAVRFMTPEI